MQIHQSLGSETAQRYNLIFYPMQKSFNISNRLLLRVFLVVVFFFLGGVCVYLVFCLFIWFV
jgi:hypothetical protein